MERNFIQLFNAANRFQLHKIGKNGFEMKKGLCDKKVPKKTERHLTFEQFSQIYYTSNCKTIRIKKIKLGKGLSNGAKISKIGWLDQKMWHFEITHQNQKCGISE